MLIGNVQTAALMRCPEVTALALCRWLVLELLVTRLITKQKMMQSLGSERLFQCSFDPILEISSQMFLRPRKRLSGSC